MNFLVNRIVLNSLIVLPFNGATLRGLSGHRGGRSSN